jgi:leucyl aminopeptidase
MPTITARVGDALATAVDALIVPVYAGEAVAAELDERFDGHLRVTLSAAGFTGRRKELAAFPTFGRLPARWLVLTGLGERARVDGEALRRAYGAAIKRARDDGARRVAALLPDDADNQIAQAATEGIELALYRFTRYKSSSADAKVVEAVELWSGSGEELAEGAARGQVVAAGVMQARDLVNTISDDKTPAQVAALARRVAAESGLVCTVLDRAALEAGGYNAIVAVGKGSAAEPHLIELRYEPAGGASKTVALVGKTLTFDAGGLDLKTADGMYKMKNDLGGGAAVLGAMQAMAALRPGVRVIGVLAAAENMPSGTAMRPRDVVRALNGKTFEIGNTDAEGRMVLTDALTHAARAGADELISVATLTGGVFGLHGSAALGNDQGLQERFLAAAGAAGERVWPLPMWDEFREDIESDIADLKTVGASWGGDTIRAAVFIGEFVEDKPWLHLDIAMVADTDQEGPYTPKGATGVLVRSLVRYVAG